MPTKLYIGNIPYSYSQEDLEKTFGEFGPVTSLQLKQGFGFVEFEVYEDAQAAIREMHSKELDGRRLKVEESKAMPKYDRDDFSRDNRDRSPVKERSGYGEKPESRHLFVANIPPTLSSTEIQEYFERFGKVENTKLLPPKGPSQALSGFVDFCDVESARHAHNSQLTMEGQTIRTDYNQRQSRPKRDFDRGDDHNDNSRGSGGYGGNRDRDSGVTRGDRYRADSRERGSYGRGSENRSSHRRSEERDHHGSRPSRYESGDAPRGSYGGYRGGYDREPRRSRSPPRDSRRDGRDSFASRHSYRDEYARESSHGGERDSYSRDSRPRYEKPSYAATEPVRGGRDRSRSPYSSRPGREQLPPRNTRGYSIERNPQSDHRGRSPPSRGSGREARDNDRRSQMDIDSGEPKSSRREAYGADPDAAIDYDHSPVKGRRRSQSLSPARNNGSPSRSRTPQ